MFFCNFLMLILALSVPLLLIPFLRILLVLIDCCLCFSSFRFLFLRRFRSFLRATILIIPIDKFRIVTSDIVMINYVLIVISCYRVDRSAKARQRIVIGLAIIFSFAKL